MRLLVHDFAGHPFQAELSRELATRGHQVTHAWFASDKGPKGRMQVSKGDAPTLAFLPVGETLAYSKTSLIKRRQAEIGYGKELARWIAETRPDLVISGNTPTETQEEIQKACRAANIPFIYWCQDFYSIAVSRLLEKKIPVAGHAVGAYYRFLERRQMQRADRVLHITEFFAEQTDAWGIPRARIEVIPNWGAIDEIDVLDRDTDWARAQDLKGGIRYLYSGTLALKHNPELLVKLAGALEGEGAGEDEVVLVSAGVGADQIAERVAAGEVAQLRCLPLQPFDVFPQVLAAGDVLLAFIEREAGTFSVPSKILSYLCAGRPIVLAAPHDNLAAKILVETGAGRVVEPEDAEGFIEAALHFRADPDAAAAAGSAGRAYAEENFVLSRVADRFEALFTSAMETKTGG